MSKAYTLKCAAYNLGLLLRKAFGMSKPRNAEGGRAGLSSAFLAWVLSAVAMAHRKLMRQLGRYLEFSAVEIAD